MEGFLERFLHFLRARDSVREQTEQFLLYRPDFVQKINAHLDLFVLLIRYIGNHQLIPLNAIPKENLNEFKNTYLWGIENYKEIYNELAGAIMLWFQGFYVHANRGLRTAFEMLLRYLYHVHINPLLKPDSETIITPARYRQGLEHHPNFQEYNSHYHFKEDLDLFYSKLSEIVHGANFNELFEEAELFLPEKCQEFADNLVQFIQYHAILLALVQPKMLQITPLDDFKANDKKSGIFAKAEFVMQQIYSF